MLDFCVQAGKIMRQLLGQIKACGCEVPTNLHCGYSIMKKQFDNILSYM